MWIPYNNIWIGRNSYKSGGGETVSPPSDLVISITKHDQLDLSFTAGGGEGHKVYISEDEVNYSLLTTLTGATTTYEATGLDEETEYFFKVTAYSGATESTAITGSETTLSDKFKFTIDTRNISDGSTDNKSYMLSRNDLLSGFDYYIDWGDGSALQHATDTEIDIVHTYATEGIYHIAISGIFKGKYTVTSLFYDYGKDISVENWGKVGWESIEYIFNLCPNFISVAPSYNALDNITSTYGAFAETGLTSIPQYFLRGCSLCTVFSSCFAVNPQLQLNKYIFYAEGEQSTRFLNQSIDFSWCFQRTSFTGTQGTAPDLWDCDFGTGTPTKTNCFDGAGNSLTSLTNYDSIPAEWK